MPSTCLFVHCRFRLGPLRAWTIDRSSLGLVAQGCGKGLEQKKCMRNLLAVRYMAQRVAGIVKTETKEQRRRCVRTLTTRAFSRWRGKLSCRQHCSITSTEFKFPSVTLYHSEIVSPLRLPRSSYLPCASSAKPVDRHIPPRESQHTSVL